MGQGNHVKLVWGTVGSIEVPEGTRDRAEALGGWECWPKTQYESRNPWCGFVVGATNGVAERGQWSMARFAVPLDEMAAYAEAVAPGALELAKKRWEAFRAVCPGAPEGRLLFVAEFD